MRAAWALRVVVGCGAAALVLAGCGTEQPRTTEVVAACWGLDRPRPDTGRVEFSFEQEGEVVATASGSVDTLMTVEVPAGKVTSILANGEPFAQVGVDGARPAPVTDGETPDAGYTVSGRGCPGSPSADESPAGG